MKMCCKMQRVWLGRGLMIAILGWEGHDRGEEEEEQIEVA